MGDICVWAFYFSLIEFELSLSVDFCHHEFVISVVFPVEKKSTQRNLALRLMVTNDCSPNDGGNPLFSIPGDLLFIIHHAHSAFILLDRNRD